MPILRQLFAAQLATLLDDVRSRDVNADFGRLTEERDLDRKSKIYEVYRAFNEKHHTINVHFFEIS